MRGSQLLYILPLLAAAENWPGFRGPSRQGLSGEARAPGFALVWKAEVPGEGWSSPIVWNRHVFITTATEQGASCHLLAFDRDSGRKLWNAEITRQPLKRKEGKNSYASPTPTTDGRYVYAVCGDGTFAAVDFRGKLRWINRDYPHYSQHGLGVSPVLADGMLIMPRDGSSEGADKKIGWQTPWEEAFIVALNPKDGKEIWKARRGPSRIAHVTPNILGRTLVSGAGDVVQRFDLKSGQRIWSARSPGEGVVPSVVLGEGLILTVSGFGDPTIRAHREDGTLAWEQKKGVPMISSLLHLAPFVYSVTTNGIAYCYRASTGEIVWQERLGGDFSASPVAVAGQILFASEQGGLTWIRAGDRFERLSSHSLPERIQASPAISNGLLFVRSATQLQAFR